MTAPAHLPPNEQQLLVAVQSDHSVRRGCEGHAQRPAGGLQHGQDVVEAPLQQDVWAGAHQQHALGHLAQPTLRSSSTVTTDLKQCSAAAQTQWSCRDRLVCIVLSIWCGVVLVWEAHAIACKAARGSNWTRRVCATEHCH